MADMCIAPDGQRPFSFGLEPRTLAFVATTLACTPFALIILGPFLVGLVGRCIGWVLLKKTEGRRSLLVGLMNDDNKKSAEQSTENTSAASSSSEEWEKVQSPDTKATTTEKSSQQDWDGIIGFFHPFWYAIKVDTHIVYIMLILDFCLAMLEVVVNAFFGLLSEQHRLAGPMQSVPSIQEIMKLPKRRSYHV